MVIMKGGGYAVSLTICCLIQVALGSKTARQDRGRSSAGVFSIVIPDILLWIKHHVLTERTPAAVVVDRFG